MQETYGHLNHLWADLIVEELTRLGVDCFCLASGSRSAPLTAAAARHPRARVHVHVDERGAAYFALGHARATGCPAVWLTTSGTAAANGLPAAVEADWARVPLLMLTADRPPELRDTGANQAIDQVGLFGGTVRWAFDLPCPSPEIPASFVLSTVDQAVHRATGTPAGPVHLNCMFREPLAPSAAGSSGVDLPGTLSAWAQTERPWSPHLHGALQMSSPQARLLAADLGAATRGLVVAGALEDDARQEAVTAMARALGWPLLPDVTSGLRLGASDRRSAAYYDLSLLSPDFRSRHVPDTVLHVGGRVVSKRLASFLREAAPPRYIRLKEHPRREDPDHLVTLNLEAGLAPAAEVILQLEAPRANTAWREAWCGASEAIRAALEAEFDPGRPVTEPGTAWTMSRLLDPGHALFLGASMPIRDVDMYADSRGAAVPVAAQRGASGIDGSVAAAAGFAQGWRKPTTALIGDLALLHDLNALALLSRIDVPVTIVLINNRGGGIFSFLPIAGDDDVFEPYFGTPHDLSFEQAAGLFGLAYACPATSGELADAYQAFSRGDGPALLEVRTDRTDNVAYHRKLETALGRRRLHEG